MEARPYPAQAIANYFIQKSVIESKEDLTLMKLMKLIYIAHGWTLALMNKPLIQEKIEAWQFGPVVNSVYHEFKRFGNRHIDSLAAKIESENPPQFQFYEIDQKDKETKFLLDKIWDLYKEYTGIQLSNWSHNEDGPWYEIYINKKGHLKKNAIIEDEKIKEYFLKFRSSSHEPAQ